MAQAGSNEKKNWVSKISLDCLFKLLSKVKLVNLSNLGINLVSFCPLFRKSNVKKHVKTVMCSNAINLKNKIKN